MSDDIMKCKPYSASPVLIKAKVVRPTDEAVAYGKCIYYFNDYSYKPRALLVFYLKWLVVSIAHYRMLAARSLDERFEFALKGRLFWKWYKLVISVVACL